MGYALSMNIRTRILTLDPSRPDPEKIALATHAIAAGQLVAFPTETVYGLGADAFNPQAVDRIFAAKQRPFSDPLIVHLAHADELDRVAIDIPAGARRLADHFWPGPLTLVLRRAGRVAPNVAAGRNTVAVRVPSHPIAHALLQECGRPIAAPSANLFSRPSPTTARDVIEDLGGRIEMVLDGGPTVIGLESTVLDMTPERPRLLRPGGVALEHLRELVPDLCVAAAPVVADLNSPQQSPGTLLKHYAPRVPMILLRGRLDTAAATMHRVVNFLKREGVHPGLLVTDEEVPLYADLCVETVSLGPGVDCERLGRSLFSHLRELDRLDVDVIIAREVEPVGIGVAINDRLFRAAAGQVLDGADARSLERFFERFDARNEPFADCA